MRNATRRNRLPAEGRLVSTVEREVVVSRFAAMAPAAGFQRRRPTARVLLAALVLIGAFRCPRVHAGATFKIDDAKSLSLGIGVRGSFVALEDGAGGGRKWSKDFNLDNARIYLNGQINKWIKVEFNTECVFCSNADLREFALLDAIAKFEFSPYLNLWGGRLLVPADRAEMDGPFYANVYEGFKTPFYPADFSVKFGQGGAGVYGRDHGVNLWGAALPGGRLQYVFGVFSGLRGLSNQDSNLLYATRIAYNVLDVEKNPGYYTSSTYYGKGGNILTIGYAAQYQKDGSGSAQHKGRFFGTSVDLLFEAPLGDAGVATAEAEYKHFDSNFRSAAFADQSGCFCMFDGDAWTATGLYLVPGKVGIGMFQPYVRYTDIRPSSSSDRNELELGLNYVIDGHNARLSLFYQYGDLATKGLVKFAPGVSGREVSAVKLAVQLQI